MSNHYDVIAVSSGGEMFNQVGEQTGVKTVPIAMTRQITPLKDLFALWSLYKLIKKERPKFVHNHTPKAGLLGMIAASKAGVPVRLHTVAGVPLLESTGLKRKVLDVQFRARPARNSRDMILSRYDQNYVWGELLREYRLN